MKLEGEIDSIDGLTVRREDYYDGFAFAVFDPERRDFFMRLSVPAKTLGAELVDMGNKPGDRLRVTVEKIP